MNPIIVIYAQLIKEGEKEIKQVPSHIRKDVEKLLKEGERVG